MRRELLANGTPEATVEDAVLVLSELLSNACRYARPLGTRVPAPRGSRPLGTRPPLGSAALGRTRLSEPADDHQGYRNAYEDGCQDVYEDVYEDYVEASWRCEPTGEVTIAVTDGGGPTRPRPATPSVSARGGRGLAIVTSLAQEWGVTEGGDSPGVTVWAVLPAARSYPETSERAGEQRRFGLSGLPGLEGLKDLEDLEDLL